LPKKILTLHFFSVINIFSFKIHAYTLPISSKTVPYVIIRIKIYIIICCWTDVVR
jgi:hypothetical protein